MSDIALAPERFAITALARACQVAAADTLEWSGWPDLGNLRNHFEGLPPPGTWEEATMATGIAVHFAARVAARVQRQLGRCLVEGGPTTVPVLSLATSADPASAGQPAAALRDWLTAYAAWLQQTRRDDPVTRAQRRLREPDCPSITRLTREVGYSRKTLERLFRSKVGVSMQTYRRRERTAVGVLLLGSSTEKVESVARAAGWKTKKGLYESLARFGLTPTAVKRMSVAEIATTVSRVRRAHPLVDDCAPPISEKH